MKTTSFAFGVAALVLVPMATFGCSTESFCFADCGNDAGSGDGSSNEGGGGYAGGWDGGGGSAAFCITCGDSGGTGGGSQPCTPTGKEDNNCDGIDDDCKNGPDDLVDFAKDPFNCGVCGAANPDANCIKKVQNAEMAKCTATPGQPNAYNYSQCLQDFWDLDGDRSNGCEYYCVKKGDTDSTCDNIDDNCNKKFDEGIDKCNSDVNCGACGRNCQGYPNATGKCVKDDPQAAFCDEKNTHCEIASCAAGYIDLNKKFADGCEYPCTPKKRTDPADPATLVDCKLGDPGCGIEYCDGEDNDCDGLKDAADPDMADPIKGDPKMGQDCYGSMVGECAQASHKGVFKCVAAKAVCADDNSGNLDCTNQPQSWCGTQNANTPYCIDAPNPGTKVCGTRVIGLNDQPELCNLLDDNCDGTTDGVTTDTGGKCGSNLGICSQGVWVCKTGQKECSGAISPQVEQCNGADDDCDGVVDGVAAVPEAKCTTDTDCQGVANAPTCMTRSGPADKVCARQPADVLDINTQLPKACEVPIAPPAGWTTPCKAGTAACVNGVQVCAGFVKAAATKDACGQDLNCNGMKDPDFDTLTDVKNCGGCGNDCTAGHVLWTCVNGTCTLPATNKCAPGWSDCDSNANDCETACTFYSKQELCNGFDDNCDCNVDEMKDAQHPDGIVAPSASQICGVSPAASDPGCTTGVAITCQAGKWNCAFGAGYCNTGNPPTCSATQDVCDNKDNNCNGSTDENFKPPILSQSYLGQACYSDDNVSPKHGLCQQAGTFKCDGLAATACMNAANQKIAGVKLPCGTGVGQSGFPCDEACDGKDNDCDGLVDEPYTNKGAGGGASYWVKPKVASIGTNLWMYSYEASRPSATGTTPGTGNGWWKTTGLATNQPVPPAGSTLDKTPSCSEPSRIPWFNVTGREAQHVCVEMGGRLCSQAEWTQACKSTTGACKWSFATTCGVFSALATGPCNLGQYDFNPGLAGDQDGLLGTGQLAGCRSAWVTGNPAYIADMTGNLRELTCDLGACTATQSKFVLMGGAFNTKDSAGEGSRCDFTFYNVDQNFKLYDVGFRCCFGQKPD